MMSSVCLSVCDTYTVALKVGVEVVSCTVVFLFTDEVNRKCPDIYFIRHFCCRMHRLATNKLTGINSRLQFETVNK